MREIILIFHLIVCIFEIWMLYDFFHTFLRSKSEIRKYRVGTIIIFALMVFAVNCFDNTIVNLLVVPIVYFLLSIVAFNGNIYIKIFETLIGTAIILGTELIVVVVLSLTSEELIESSMVNEPSAIMLTIIVKMITFIIFAVIKQSSSKKTQTMDLGTFMLYIIAPLSGLGIMFSIVFCNIDFSKGSLAKYMLVIFFFLLMIGDAAVFYGYNRYARVLTEKEDNRRTVEMQKMELESYRKVNIANNRYMTLLHDTNHHMNTVYGLLINDKKGEAVNMLESLFYEYQKAEMIEYSNNNILNIILSECKEESERKNIECDIFVERGFNIEYVDDIDLVALISNLLSNAYEAAIKSEEKKIKIQMFMQNDGSFSVIKIENSFNGKILKEGEALKTTKFNKKLHGFGIKSAERIAEKYDGWISNKWENYNFKTIVILENRWC